MKQPSTNRNERASKESEGKKMTQKMEPHETKQTKKKWTKTKQNETKEKKNTTTWNYSKPYETQKTAWNQKIIKQITINQRKKRNGTKWNEMKRKETKGHEMQQLESTKNKK